MKKTLFILLILGLFAGAQAQNARKDAKGNYVAINSARDSTATGKTFTDQKSQVYPVFANHKGKLYYIRTSKTGKIYRSYLKIEGYAKD